MSPTVGHRPDAIPVPEETTAAAGIVGGGLGFIAIAALIALAIAVASGTLLWVLNTISAS